MSAPARHPSASLPLWCGLAAFLVVMRSVVYVHWEQSHFDSDHAIVGLMALHLSQLKTWPLFFYGQGYMLAVEAWIVAPLFAMFGASVTVLRLPLLAMNVVAAILLLRTLVRDLSITPAAAFVASLFFVVPSVVASTHLIEPMGGSVEPFIYMLLLWRLRSRPWLFGLIAGIGFLHREFTAYGVVAVVFLELLHARELSRAAIRLRAVSLGVMALTVTGFLWWRDHAAIMGPGSAGTPSRDRLAALASVAHLCLMPSTWLGNLRWLFAENLATLFGARAVPLWPYFHSTLSAGHPAVAIGLAVLAGLAILAAWRFARHGTGASLPNAARAHADRLVPPRMFSLYLVLVGVQAAFVYAFLGCDAQNLAFTRYTLLVLFGPVGAVGWLYSIESRPIIRAMATATVVMIAALAGSDNLRVLREYLVHPPPSELRELTECLEGAGIRYARAPYWTAYAVDFLSQERITVASTEMTRIQEYQRSVDAHSDEAVTILDRDGACPDHTFMALRSFCVVAPRRR